MLLDAPTDDCPDLTALPLDDLLVKRKSLRRRLSARPGLQPIRIAILSGSTAQETADLLELYLLAAGFDPALLIGDYGRFHVDSVYSPADLIDFRPDLVYLHTSVLNLGPGAALQASGNDLEAIVANELGRFRQIWDSIESKLSCLIVQNNFELPLHPLLGNLEPTLGQTRVVLELNRAFATTALERPRLLLNDVHSLSARIGLDHWFDPQRYFAYKLVTTPEGSNALAASVAAIVGAAYGRTRKVLVLDLDNTLWGGVIGDDGLDHIQIGRETPVAEAYSAFQRYCLALRDRGILLAVCSKNEPTTARSGFSHPDSLLRLEHFASFQASWEPKPAALERIARELNVSLDALVFVDDNPAERALVRAQLPQVAVPEIGSDVATYPRVLDQARYFEQTSFSAEDLNRAALYQANVQRHATQARFTDYGQYLDSLEMTAEIAPFCDLYLDRIAQLTNKTNQFNLTTRRYTLAELQACSQDRCAITLYARLADRFGENGLVSVLLGHRVGSTLSIDLWLMSCRVLKRDLESAMLDALADRAQAEGISVLEGTYLPTRKNAMVAGHYASLGFTQISRTPEGATTWRLSLENYAPRNRHIHVLTAQLQPV